MNPVRNPYLQTPFLLCVGVLTVSAIGMKAAMHWAGVQAVKLSLPLQKPLDQIDVQQLSPYKVIEKAIIRNPDILQSLGTRDYIQWLLEDPQVPSSSPVRYCSLFITYYTGNPDRVPHVPDECYVGGGNIQKKAETLTLDLQTGASPVGSALPAKLSVRQSVFASKQANQLDPQAEFSVLYFFKANGEYADGRTGVRFIMSKNFTCKYSYFSKVEWKFSGTGSSPSTEDIVKASEKLMSVLLPLLETRHWPDWEKAKQDSVSKP
jgi:hypothetical protein